MLTANFYAPFTLATPAIQLRLGTYIILLADIQLEIKHSEKQKGTNTGLDYWTWFSHIFG